MIYWRPMAKLQDIFSQLEDTKLKQRQLRRTYREALAQSPWYQQQVTEWQAVRDKKRTIEQAIKSEFQSEFDQLDRLAREAKSATEVLSEAAFNQLVRGETVRVTDTNANEYEPVFTVRFKKIK